MKPPSMRQTRAVGPGRASRMVWTHPPGAGYAKGMTAFLSARQIRIFDYPRFAEPLRNRVRDRAAKLASAAGVTIEHIAKSHIRKEDVVGKVLAVRGDHPGLVHIISAMEACDSYKPWHDKRTRSSIVASLAVISNPGTLTPFSSLLREARVPPPVRQNGRGVSSVARVPVGEGRKQGCSLLRHPGFA